MRRYNFINKDVCNINQLLAPTHFRTIKFKKCTLPSSYTSPNVDNKAPHVISSYVDNITYNAQHN